MPKNFSIRSEWGSERPHHPSGPRDGGPLGSHPEKGNPDPGRCLPHPERERLPFAAERMDETIPRSSHQILGPLSGLASRDREIWRASQLHTVVDFIPGRHELQQELVCDAKAS